MVLVHAERERLSRAYAAGKVSGRWNPRRAYSWVRLWEDSVKTSLELERGKQKFFDGPYRRLMSRRVVCHEDPPLDARVVEGKRLPGPGVQDHAVIAFHHGAVARGLRIGQPHELLKIGDVVGVKCAAVFGQPRFGAGVLQPLHIVAARAYPDPIVGRAVEQPDRL